MPTDTFNKLSPKKKNQIISAAIEEFAQMPFQDVNIKQLISKMGIPIGSFYQYFADKKDLYFYVLSIFLERSITASNESGIRMSITDNNRERRGAMIHPKLAADPFYKAIVKDNFNKAPPEIKRDWYFDVVMKEYLWIYESQLFDEAGIAQKCKDNKDILLSMFISIRSVVEQYADYSSDYETYRKLWDLCFEVLKTGVRSVKDS